MGRKLEVLYSYFLRKKRA